MWKSKIILSNETLKHERSWTSGFMEEQDNELYIVFNEEGAKTGEVKVTDHTAVKGFKRTCRVVQTDINGKIIVDSNFDPE